MEAMEALMTRRSVRKFTDRPVEAALAAPGAKNLRPCRFLVTGDEKILRTLSKKLTEAGQQGGHGFGAGSEGSWRRRITSRSRV